jgi:hypothetical protein
MTITEPTETSLRFQVNVGENIEAANGDFYKTIIEVPNFEYFIKTSSDEKKFLAAVENSDVFEFRFKAAIANPLIRTKLLLWQKENKLSDHEVRRLLTVGIISISASKFEKSDSRWLGTAGKLQIVFACLICSICIVCTAITRPEVTQQFRDEMLIVTFWGIWSYFIFRYFILPTRIMSRINAHRKIDNPSSAR